MFYVQEPPPPEVIEKIREQLKASQLLARAVVQAHAIWITKATGDENDHIQDIRIIGPDGETNDPSSQPLVANFKPRVSGAVGGSNIVVQLSFTPKALGTYYVCGFIDGKELCRTPITLLPQSTSSNSQT